MKRSKMLRLALATVFVGAFAMNSLAQGGGFQGPPAGGPGKGGGFQGGPGQGGPGGPGGMQMRRGGMQSGMLLVQMKSVQRELNMTADQIQKISNLRPPMGGPGQGGPGGPPPIEVEGFEIQGPPQGGQGQGGQRGGFQGGPPQNVQGRPLQGGPQGFNPMEQLGKILNDGQMKRLHQLMLQFDAPMTILDPRIGEALNLSDEQRQSIQKIVQESFPRMGGGPGFGGPGGPPPGGQGQGGQRGGFQGGPPQGGQGRGPGGQGGPMVNWSEQQAKKAAALKAALKVLDGEQRSAWSKLTGATFDKWEEPTRPRD